MTIATEKFPESIFRKGNETLSQEMARLRSMDDHRDEAWSRAHLPENRLRHPVGERVASHTVELEYYHTEIQHEDEDEAVYQFIGRNVASVSRSGRLPEKPAGAHVIIFEAPEVTSQ